MSAVRSSRGPRVPLRITLVALLVALVAVALAVTGVAATSLLKDYLREQQDGELKATAAAYAQDRTVLAACLNPPSRVIRAPTYVACVAPGGEDVDVIAAPPAHEESAPDVDEDDVSALRAGADPITVRSEDRDSHWRMAAEPLPRGYTLVVGTDVGRDDAAIGRLVTLQVVVGLVVLTLLGGTGYVLVRNSLRPLDEVERTAKAIAAGDLSQRVPAANERTEVGRLSTALNGMLARIESAFRAQQASEEKARGVGGAHAPLRRRRQPRAADAADLHPRIRRAVPAGRRPDHPRTSAG